MGKCSNPGKSFGRKVTGIKKKTANVTNTIPKRIYVASFIQIGYWESVHNQGKGFGGKGRWTEFREKKMQTSQMQSEN